METDGIMKKGWLESLFDNKTFDSEIIIEPFTPLLMSDILMYIKREAKKPLLIVVIYGN